MGITIEQISLDNLSDAGMCDGRFTVDSKLILAVENHVIQYTVVPAGPYAKQYPVETVEYGAHLNNPERTIYFAYLQREIAGQLRLRRNWNQYAYVEDLVVDVKFRRRGIGRALLERAVQWAKDQHLSGVMLETQDNNVAACRLYQQSGFALGGFDRFLYHGQQPDTDEVALFWYFRFRSETS
jgi:streptothricin acetyltransferase